MDLEMVKLEEELQQCVHDGQLLLANVKTIQVVSIAGVNASSGHDDMLMRVGKVEDHCLQMGGPATEQAL